MTSSTADAPATSRTPWWSVVLQSLLPTLAFLIPVAVAGGFSDTDGESGDTVGTLLFSLAIITLPCFLALLAAKDGTPRRIVLVVLTVLAAALAATVVFGEDAQSALGVLLIPMFALPLALILWIGRSFSRKKTTRPEV